MTVNELTERQRHFLARRLDDVDLSVRASNCLKNINIKYVSELFQYSATDLMRIPNFGKKSLREIEAVFEAEGLTLGHSLPADFIQQQAIAPGTEVKPEKLNGTIELSAEQKAFLAMPLSEFLFSSRVSNFFKRSNLRRVGDLAILGPEQVKKAQGLGRTSRAELIAFLDSHRITQGIRIPEWTEQVAASWAEQHSIVNIARLTLDPYLYSDAIPKSLDWELSALTKLALGANQERNARIVCRFFGFEGTGRKTLEEVGVEYNITRERVRQIVVQFSRRVRGKHVHLPLLNLARSVIEHELPALESDIVSSLCKEHIVTKSFDCSGILAAVSLFDPPTPLRVVSIEGLRVVGDAPTLDSVKRAPAIARTIVSALGCGHLEHVMGDLEIAYDQKAACKVVSALLESIPGLNWLDAQREWFTIADAKRNRLANIIRKVLFVSPDISLSEMRGALQRVHRLGGFSPPRAILREFCKTLAFCRVVDDRILATEDLPSQVTLGEIEQRMFEVLREFGPAMHVAAFRDECLRRGVNTNSFSVYLGNSPILCRLAPETYALVGASISPGEIDDLRLQKVARAPVMLDHGWLGDGRLWLSYRLNLSNIRAGVFSVPSGMRSIVDGEYFIQSADTGSRSSIVIGAGRLSGLRRPLAILGAEDGDTVRLVLDPRNRQAEMSFAEQFPETTTEKSIESTFQDVADLNDNNQTVGPIEITEHAQESTEWQPISAAPALRDLEVRLADSSGRYALLFPCKLLSDGTWINSWLQTPLGTVPIEWREWTESPFEF